ncbi:solute:sodium symporter family transporter [Metabacillus sp. GX 13764]|uniref:solute:sodium symporter family transporter n=1 Tax=Metabacillus kandeliae TaxID=2900151 RepID=UPI001E29454D|nr:solute:sodium symporter family transporter [Metabacillus kandeliae]MCD7036496.1 solute:sodium symporter family transporter [Metabacillus kandeliae]
MNEANIWFTLLSCAFFMGLVAFISYKKSKDSVNDSNGYFLAGRGLNGTFIAGSLLLTNLSAEQLVGLNGQAYRTNLSNMAWEVTAALPIIIMALYLLPKYLGGNFTTLPEFLSKRFDQSVRFYIVLLFMLGYIFVTSPSMLYSGAIAVLQMFDVPSLLGISYEQSIWLVVWVVGIIGAIYAIFGGLKAVAISDTLNGIGLLIIGALVPILALIALGNGSFLGGVTELTTVHPEKLNAIGTNTDSVPFGTIFTGMLIANLFYWASNQYVIQRTLGAKNLAEGQKGVIISGFYKLLIPMFMMIPGVIAFHQYGDSLKSVDLAYPTLISNVLPIYLSGLFLAVLLGAVFSSFNSLLNSAATMFALDIYKAKINPNADDKKVIMISQWFGTALALITLFVAPLLMYAQDGLWDLIRKFTGFFNVPIIAILLAGVLTKRVPAIACKAAIFFHIPAYYMIIWGTDQLFSVKWDINFIYVYAILFVIEMVMMLAFGYFKPKTEPFEFKSQSNVDMVPWKLALPASIVLLALVAMTYLVFSPVGLAYERAAVSPYFWPGVGLTALMAAILIYLSIRHWNKKYKNYLKRQELNIDRVKGRKHRLSDMQPSYIKYKFD